MTQRLFVRSITSIGAVGEGDNPDATIMFYKSKNTEPVQGRTQKKEGSMPFDIETLTDEGKEFVASLQAQIAAFGDEPPVLPDDLDPVTKARLDDDQATIEKQKVEMEKVAKDLADLRDEMATEKYDTRAEELEALLGDKADVAPVLKALAAADPVAFGKLDGMFDTLVVKDTLAPLFAELGEAGQGGTAIDQIAAHTAEIRKANPDVSLAEAKKQAWEDHPELLAKSREEK